MIVKEIAKFENPPIVRKSSCAYPRPCRRLMSWAMSFSFSERADEAIGTSFYQKQGDDMGNDICLIVHYTEQFVKRDGHPKSRQTENWANNQVNCSASFPPACFWVPTLFFREEDAFDLGI